MRCGRRVAVKVEAVKIYEGEQPYLFISYAHANAPAVMQVAGELADRGYRLWYDNGIEPGSEWQEYIAGRLAGSALVIAFISGAYNRSDNCRRELHFALSKKIPVITIFLEDTALTPGMEMQIGNLFALMKYAMPEQQFYEKLFAAPQLNEELRGETAPGRPKRKGKRKKVAVDLGEEAKRRKRKKRRRLIGLGVLALLLIAALVLGIVGYSTGLLQRVLISRELSAPEELPGDTPVRLSSAALEKKAREYCKIPEGELRVSDLSGLTELTLTGADGALSDLSELRYFPDLVRLELSELSLSSLETLPPCGLEELSISACAITKLRGIEALSMLRELTVTDCPLRQINGLEHCLQLRKLVIINGNVSDFSPAKPLTKLTELELSDCALNELRVLMRMSSLSDVKLLRCDLRGRFFKGFDRERAIVSLSLTDCKLNSTKNLEDFTGLTTLTLIRSGETLDWSRLGELPVLNSVTVDATMEESVRGALSGSDAELTVLR